MELHINHIVSVRLTEKGAQVYNDFHAHLPPDHWNKKKEYDTVLEPLWFVMKVFGPHSDKATENLFHPNVISL